MTVAVAIPKAFSETVDGRPTMPVADLQLARSDGDNSPQLTLTDTIVTQPVHGTITNFDPASGSYTYTPTVGYHGPDSFTFTVTDGVNTSSAGTISLSILASGDSAGCSGFSDCPARYVARHHARRRRRQRQPADCADLRNRVGTRTRHADEPLDASGQSYLHTGSGLSGRRFVQIHRQRWRHLPARRSR